MTTVSEEVTVREAVRADLLDVFRIEQRVFPQPWPFEAFEQFLGQPGFLIAEGTATPPSAPGSESGSASASASTSMGRTEGSRSVDAVSGYVVADLTPNFGRDIGHVKDLAVRPDRQGAGVGTALLRHALATLEAEGAASVKLEVREGNDAAIGLYRHHGFEHRRTVPGYYANGENALVMVRD